MAPESIGKSPILDEQERNSFYFFILRTYLIMKGGDDTLNANCARELTDIAKNRQVFLNSAYSILDEEIRKAANRGENSIVKEFTVDRETISVLARVLKDLGYTVSDEIGEMQRLVISW